ncbi:MAG: AmmeMemoRadiSam system protein A [Terriglobia bacterium]
MLPLSEGEQSTLLLLARRSLEAAVGEGCPPQVDAPSGVLNENRGAFVTLFKGGRLRGCIGYVEPQKPLYQAVAECALAAALHDPRFDPVRPSELPSIHLEVSVLSPLEDITPDKIEVGRHGLLVSRGFYRGLLLPQVAVEWKWDARKFLEETCTKAGLPTDAWRHGARIQAFTAQIFGETRRAARSSPHAA